jgi:molybdopterin converting factor small subunit
VHGAQGDFFAHFETKNSKRKETIMKVEIFRLTGQPISVDVPENATVRSVFAHPESGKAIGKCGVSLIEAAENAYGSVAAMGNLRVNGYPATLDTPVAAGATILIIPKAEGGC